MLGRKSSIRRSRTTLRGVGQGSGFSPARSNDRSARGRCQALLTRTTVAMPSVRSSRAVKSAFSWVVRERFRMNGQRDGSRVARARLLKRGQEATCGAVEGEALVLIGRGLTETRQSLDVAPHGTRIRLVLLRQSVRLVG